MGAFAQSFVCSCSDANLCVPGMEMGMEMEVWRQFAGLRRSRSRSHSFICITVRVRIRIRSFVSLFVSLFAFVFIYLG